MKAARPQFIPMIIFFPHEAPLNISAAPKYGMIMAWNPSACIVESAMPPTILVLNLHSHITTSSNLLDAPPHDLEMIGGTLEFMSRGKAIATSPLSLLLSSEKVTTIPPPFATYTGPLSL